ncbi:hypothetical protein HYI36_05340 [Bacillus sp. Gen3]|nr:hypothetical protein [Bacillus sp. Gen3]
MRIKFDYHLDIEGTKNLTFGIFEIPPYKENNEYLLRLAYNRFQEIKKLFGYRDIIIEKLIYNGEKDFAEELKKIINLPIDELLDWEQQGEGK